MLNQCALWHQDEIEAQHSTANPKSRMTPRTVRVRLGAYFQRSIQPRHNTDDDALLMPCSFIRFFSDKHINGASHCMMSTCTRRTRPPNLFHKRLRLAVHVCGLTVAESCEKIMRFGRRAPFFHCTRTFLVRVSCDESMTFQIVYPTTAHNQRLFTKWNRTGGGTLEDSSGKLTVSST